MYTQPPEQGQGQQNMYSGAASTGVGGPTGGAPRQGVQNSMLGSQEADAMLNFGISQGSSMLKQQQDKWMPGVSGFWQQLKIYFAANNTYVVKKLSMILYPLGVKSSQSWIRKNAEDGGYDNTLRNKWALPKDDTCAPDLYIPSMSFITYVLLYGLCTGMGSGAFSPEILIQAIWRCFIVQVLEVGIVVVALNFINSSLPFLDIFSYTGYKYVGLCVSTLARTFGKVFSILTCLYTSAMLAHFILKSMASLVPPVDSSGRPPVIERHWVLLGIAGTQFIVAMFLGAWY